jgi:hypothetical protein
MCLHEHVCVHTQFKSHFASCTHRERERERERERGREREGARPSERARERERGEKERVTLVTASPRALRRTGAKLLPATLVFGRRFTREAAVGHREGGDVAGRGGRGG